MRSDVPVGSCLSGGLDSTSIVCIVRKTLALDSIYHTFTGRFPDTLADEWSFASQIIETTGVESHVVIPTVDGFLNEVSDFIWLNELPVGSSSQYAQYCVFRLAKQSGVTVLLDGQGSDEILAGYEQYFAFYLESLRQDGRAEFAREEERRIRERYPLALVPPLRAFRDRLPFRAQRWLSHHLGVGSNLLFGIKPERVKEICDSSQRPHAPRFNPLVSALYQDSFGRYLTTLLRYGDRNSMAHSREVRLPFCDHRLAEFVVGLPPEMLVGNTQTKRILRDAMRGFLPEPVRTRWNKQGFRPPQQDRVAPPYAYTCE
jgi:asparagine synthase (glutamine-hydrolysing)